MWAIIATWRMAKEGLAAATHLLERKASAGTALEQAISDVEAVEYFKSVGYGGLPNRAGAVELDAAFMDGNTLEFGAVGALQRIAHPLRVARKLAGGDVNNFLVGTGAEQFAYEQGFVPQELLSERARILYTRRLAELSLGAELTSDTVSTAAAPLTAAPASVSVSAPIPASIPSASTLTQSTPTQSTLTQSTPTQPQGAQTQLTQPQGAQTQLTHSQFVQDHYQIPLQEPEAAEEHARITSAGSAGVASTAVAKTKPTSEIKRLLCDDADLRSHDTVGMVCLDTHHSIAAATSSSGLFMKHPGRVGDSAIPGAGLYADSALGGAASTGLGEDVIKGCVAYEIVRLLGDGLHPQQACEQAIACFSKKLIERRGHAGDMSFVALDDQGRWGAASNIEGFSFVVATEKEPLSVYVVQPEADGRCTHKKASPAWEEAYMKARMVPLEEL